MPPSEGKEEHQSRQRGWAKSAGVYSVLVFALPSCVIGGFLLGNWLDEKLGSHPWMTLIGLIVGSFSGFHQMYRILFNKRS